MALTKAQWLAKIEAMVPSWFYKETEVGAALLSALAAVCSDLQEDIEANRDKTFISRATQGVLDTHGAEREISRLPNERAGTYSVRVRNLFDQSSIPALTSLVDQILIRGHSRIQDDYDNLSFCNREVFCNQGAVLLADQIYNTFTIFVDNQLHDPYAFLGREYFASREDFIGATDSPIELFRAIQQLVDANKAGGTLYRIIERAE